MIRDLLPIGSVVYLRGADKKVMIIGIKVAQAGDAEKVFDYIGVLYPEGYIGNRQGNVLFNHSDINDVVFEGYRNPEREAFIEMMEKAEAGEEA